MGKQNRRKKGNKKSGAAKSSNQGSAAPITSKSSLVQRLRHGDLRLKHGALTAASATLFAPESLAKNAPITTELIQAVSERVMDEDTPCSMVALGCLGNYILFQESQKNANQVETLLTPILLRKMNQACDKVESIAKEMIAFEESQPSQEGDMETVESKKKKKKGGKKPVAKSMEKFTLAIMEQWSVLSLCLHAICGLVESTATTNESSSVLYHERELFLGTTLRSLRLGAEMVTVLASPDTNMKKSIATKENESNIISDVVTYATRTIHSACDDNQQFVSSLLAANGGNDWKTLIISSVGNTVLPTLARLHCCGITIICRQITKSDELTQIVMQQSLPLLAQCTVYSNDIASALHKQVAEAYQVVEQEKKDEMVEKDIIRMVDKKKESARLIARRQKQIKAEAKKAAKEAMEAEKASEDMEETEKSMSESKSDMDDADQAKEEAEEKFEKAVNAWKNACLPLKLSIEIITNAFALANANEGGEGGDFGEDDMGWNSDQEEEFLAASEAQEQEFALSKDDELYINQIISTGLPDSVLAVFGSIFTAIVSSGKTNESIHSEVLEDLTDAVRKCSQCLGNIVCNTQNSWKISENDVVAVWKDLSQCLQAAKDPSCNMNINVSAIASVVSTMGAFLRFRPLLVKLVNEQDLEMILSFVLITAPSNNKSEEEMDIISDIQKETIGMLGILCSQTHPRVVNERICDTFLTLLSRSMEISASVIGEVINALIDMYSADEGDPGNHEAVFRSKGVLDAFQKSVPVLKKKIKSEESKGALDFEDAEFLKEVALNGTRFIKYKRSN